MAVIAEIKRTNVLGVGVSSLCMKEAVKVLMETRQQGQPGYVCVTGVHGIIESQRDAELRSIHNRSLLTVPDGMPTVWMGREQGFTKMGRVYGPDLMLRMMESTSESDRSMTHFLYGATQEVLTRLEANLKNRFLGARIVGSYAPPFRPLNEFEESELKGIVASCRPDFFWVGLSTPKQERFMAAHADNPDFGIMLGVGAAFPIHAGLQRDAPEWIKNAGLQWLHRLCQEPRRLWRRYLDIIPRFLWLASLQLLGIRKFTIHEATGRYNGA